MGKVEDALRDLIQYHSKRVAGEVVGEVPSELREARRDIRALQRSLDELSSDVQKLMEAYRQDMAVPPAPEEEVEEARFTRRTLSSIRRRFDLTQTELAELLEVSPATVTAWETGKSKPRRANMAQIVTLRDKMDQREVDEALGREPAPSQIEPDQIRKIRDQFSLTQAELAELLDVSAASITSWESGKTRPSRQNRRAIVEVRETPPVEINRRLGRDEAVAAVTRGRPKTELSPDEVKEIREEVGLTQKQLAEEIGVSANSISNWETGRSEPRRRNIQKLLVLQSEAG